jgi:cation transport ATPase
MEPRWPRRSVAAGAILLGVVVFCSPAFPPSPVPGWILVGAFVTSVEHWRHTVPDAHRTTTWYLMADLIYSATVATVYWGLMRPLRRSGDLYPRRSIVLAAIIVFLSTVYFIVSWQNGLKYQGAGLLSLYVLANVVAVVLLAEEWYVFHKSGRWWPSFWLHWFLFAWALILAFPWLGERI